MFQSRQRRGSSRRPILDSNLQDETSADDDNEKSQMPFSSSFTLRSIRKPASTTLTTKKVNVVSSSEKQVVTSEKALSEKLNTSESVLPEKYNSNELNETLEDEELTNEGRNLVSVIRKFRSKQSQRESFSMPLGLKSKTQQSIPNESLLFTLDGAGDDQENDDRLQWERDQLSKVNYRGRTLPSIKVNKPNLVTSSETSLPVTEKSLKDLIDTFDASIEELKRIEGSKSAVLQETLTKLEDRSKLKEKMEKRLIVTLDDFVAAEKKLEISENWCQWLEKLLTELDNKRVAIELAHETLNELSQTLSDSLFKKPMIASFASIDYSLMQHEEVLIDDTYEQIYRFPDNHRFYPGTLVYQLTHNNSSQFTCLQHKELFGEISLIDNDPDVQSYVTERDKFAKGVISILDTKDSLIEFSSAVDGYSSFHESHPEEYVLFQLDESLESLAAFFADFSWLCWDPFISESYWDSTCKRIPLRTTSTCLAGLNWFVEINKHWKLNKEADVTVSSQKLISNIICHVVTPRVTHWISNFWCPFYHHETKLLKNLIVSMQKFSEPDVTDKIRQVCSKIAFERFKTVSGKLLDLPLDYIKQNKNETHQVLWKTCALAHAAVFLISTLLNADDVRTFCWQTLFPRMLQYFNAIENDKNFMEPLLFIILMPWKCQEDLPPPPADIQKFLNQFYP